MQIPTNPEWLLPVLTYHRIGEPSRQEPPGTISPRTFRLHLECLKDQGYTTVTADNLRQALQGRACMPPRPVMLTFDDGYADLATHAFPAMLSAGCTGTVFVVTSRIGRTNTWDQARGWRALPLLSAEQIRFWAERGIEFGAHSRTHPHLTRLSPTDLAAELGGSAHDLSCLLGRAACSLAYPHGAHNTAVRDIAVRHFDLAFGCQEGLNHPGSDPWRIRRTMVQAADALNDFCYRLERGRSPIHDRQHWRARLRLRTRAQSLLQWLRS